MSEPSFQTIIMLGASGAIGGALIRTLLDSATTRQIFALSRTPIEIVDPRVSALAIDLENETSLIEAAASCQVEGGVDLIINTIGILHESPWI